MDSIAAQTLPPPRPTYRSVPGSVGGRPTSRLTHRRFHFTSPETQNSFSRERIKIRPSAIAGLAIMTNTAVLLILLGGIFVIEVLSVVIQVISFQTFRKRVFLMAPIHHHFELQAWSETKIILRFWIVAAACGAIGFVVYQLSIRG